MADEQFTVVLITSDSFRVYTAPPKKTFLERIEDVIIMIVASLKTAPCHGELPKKTLLIEYPTM